MGISFLLSLQCSSDFFHYHWLLTICYFMKEFYVCELFLILNVFLLSSLVASWIIQDCKLRLEFGLDFFQLEKCRVNFSHFLFPHELLAPPSLIYFALSSRAALWNHLDFVLCGLFFFLSLFIFLNFYFNRSSLCFDFSAFCEFFGISSDIIFVFFFSLLFFNDLLLSSSMRSFMSFHTDLFFDNYCSMSQTYPCDDFKIQEG